MLIISWRAVLQFNQWPIRNPNQACRGLMKVRHAWVPAIEIPHFNQYIDFLIKKNHMSIEHWTVRHSSASFQGPELPTQINCLWFLIDLLLATTQLKFGLCCFLPLCQITKISVLQEDYDWRVCFKMFCKGNNYFAKI